MKEFLEIDFKLTPADARDMLLAMLDNMGYDSFQETDEGLKAYILEDEFDEDTLKELFFFNDPAYQISYEVDRLENKNWNEEWETNYSPISVGDQLYIRAPFHPPVSGYPLQLVIIPKMSFGTGHHQTTRLMARLLLKTDLKDKRVLDMGTGTGILAILSEKLGATYVEAIDNFDWAVENTRENAELNSCINVHAELGDATVLAGRSYDVLIANINRNVLLEDIKFYRETLKAGAMLLLSGFFEEDMPLIREEAERCGGRLIATEKEDRWVACRFEII